MLDGDRFLGTLLTAIGSERDVDLCDSWLAQCLDAMPNLVEMTDTYGGTVFLNRAALDYFGPEKTWAKTAAERDCCFYHPEDRNLKRDARTRVSQRNQA